jgi:uncharacterized repeat protein (TIGR02543 family)
MGSTKSTPAIKVLVFLIICSLAIAFSPIIETKTAALTMGKILFTFDDGWQDQYDYAFPILEKAGFDGTAYVCRDIASGTSAEMMRLPQLQELYAAGWDVGNHTTNHLNTGASTKPADLEILRNIYLDNQNWIIQRIGARGAFHVCYPSGYYSPALIGIIQGQGVITARAANNDAEFGFTPTPVTDPADFYELPVISLESSDKALDYALPAIEQAAADGSTVVFMIHRVEPTNGNLVLTTTDLQAIVNYASRYVSAGQLNVMTISEWYAASTPPETPAPPAIVGDDAANTIIGMTAGMEYNLDGKGYQPYNAAAFASTNLDGQHYILVRQAATATAPAGQPEILIFKAGSGQGRVLFTFDDGWQGQSTNAFPILAAAGFKATAYVNKDSVYWDPDGNFVSEADLNSLYSAGWDIASHTTNHAALGSGPDWQGITYDNPAGWALNYLANQDWLESATATKNSWIRGARHVNYPGGLLSAQLITYLKGIGALTGRTSTWGMQNSTGIGGDDFFNLKVVAIDNSDPWYLNNAKVALDNAVLDGTTVIFMIHRVEPDLNSTPTALRGITLLSATFSEIVAYASTYVKAGQLSVMTISEWYALLNGSPVPEPDPVSVSITFDADGGVVLPTSQSKLLGSAYGKADDGTTTALLPSPTRSGYLFAGWWTGDNGAGTKIADATIVTNAVSHTLHAKWTAATYSITFDSQGGSSVTARTANYNSTISAPTSPSRSGYIFAGWYTSPSFTMLWDFATSTVTENRTLYACWLQSPVSGLAAQSNSYNSIKLTWTAAAGATGYAVYRATSSSGIYTLISSAAATGNYVDSDSLATGTTYFYKVKACRQVGTAYIYSAFSKVVSAKPVLATPSVFAVARASSTSIKISWSPVTGASGYEVRRATSSTGSYSLITSTTATEYTNTGLVAGRIYFYKVRAYTMVGTTKVYSSYTSILSS